MPDPAAVTGPVVVLGGGSLGSALLTGLADAGVADLRTTTRTRASAERYEGAAVAAVALEDDPAANRAAVAGAGIVVAAVKPAGMTDLLAEIGPGLPSEAVVVSLAVGTPLAPLEAVLPAGTAVVRAMPNTPIRVRRGVTGIARGAAVPDEAFAAVERLFGLVGDVVVLDEARIDRLAAVAGSGPAYVYLLLERLADAAVGLGFTRPEAERSVASTFAGALALLESTGEQPAALRNAVTSPNGTTAAALAVLEARGLGATLQAALDAAVARADELAAR